MSEHEHLHEGCDAAELTQASTVDDPIDHFVEGYCPTCDQGVNAVCPSCKNHVEPVAGAASSSQSALTGAEFYRRFVNMLQASRNTRFTLGCYLIATGDSYADGVSMTEFGEKWGVGKAAVSKHCRQICALLQIPPSRYMRKEETAAKFKSSNRRPTKMK